MYVGVTSTIARDALAGFSNDSKLLLSAPLLSLGACQGGLGFRHLLRQVESPVLGLHSRYFLLQAAVPAPEAGAGCHELVASCVHSFSGVIGGSLHVILM